MPDPVFVPPSHSGTVTLDGAAKPGWVANEARARALFAESERFPKRVFPETDGHGGLMKLNPFSDGFS